MSEVEFEQVSLSPFADAIGPFSLRRGPNPTFRVTVSPMCANTMGRMHGGFLAAVFDICLTRGARLVTDDGRSVVTASTHIDYLAAARVGDVLEITVTLDRASDTISFSSCVAMVSDRVIGKASTVLSSKPTGGTPL